MTDDQIHQITHLTLRAMELEDMIMEAMFVSGKWCADHGKPMNYDQISDWIHKAKLAKGWVHT